jgi:hypothetical protein
MKAADLSLTFRAQFPPSSDLCHSSFVLRRLTNHRSRSHVSVRPLRSSASTIQRCNALTIHLSRRSRTAKAERITFGFQLRSRLLPDLAGSAI